MPNIHVCGFEWAVYDNYLKPLIDKVLQEIGLGNDTVTTFWPIPGCVVESCDGKRRKMPYITVSSTDSQEITKIIDALRKADIGVDCERMTLDGFTPDKDMRNPSP